MINLLIYQIGVIAPPPQVGNFGDVATGPGKLLQTIFTTMIALGGIYSLINFILAGYSFLTAGDDPKKVEGAWAKIWQTAIGLTVMAGTFLLGAIFGKLIFGSSTYVLSPFIPTL